MKLLIDTDAFCKLGIIGLLPDTIGRVFGTEIGSCGRLPSLPYMLRKGDLRKKYGGNECDKLIPLANSMSVLPSPSVSWLEKLVPIDEIDPGEVQILAAAAANPDLYVLTGDKRALRALKKVEGITDLLSGRIAVVEAILLALCDKLGYERVNQCIAPLAQSDYAVKFCFSGGSLDAKEGLLSYYRALSLEVEPLALWNPQT